MLLFIPSLATGRQGRAFLPTDIAGLKLWLKADAITGLSNSDPVASWLDQSGNGNDASQASGPSQPLYKTGIINSLPTVLFDGSDDFMSCSSTVAGRPMTMFIVVQPTLNTASQKNYATIASGGSSSMFIVAKIATSFWGTFTTPTGDLSSTNALSSGTNYLLEGTSAANSTFLYQKGVQVATRSETASSPAAATSVGKDLINANRQYAGHIAEVIMYDSVLSSGNIALVETYLISKYAL